MASVTVTVDGTPEDAARRSGDKHLRMFTREAGLMLLPLLPVSVSTADAADVWETVPRPKRKPLLYRSGKNLEKPSYSLELWNRGDSVAAQKKQLKDLARSQDPVVVTMSSNEWGTYRITGLAFTDSEWLAGGRSSRCTVDIELTEASDAAVVVGPVPHGGGKGFAK